jgi:CheY-like chemotaxis protein
MGYSYRYKTALLVDDSYIDNQINIRVLESNNYAETIIVQPPVEAIEYIKESILKNNLPEVLFLDIRMPIMNGFDFLSALDQIVGFEESKIKIYVLSSSLNPQDFKEIRENKLVSAFLCKPLTNEIFKEI